MTAPDPDPQWVPREDLAPEDPFNKPPKRLAQEEAFLWVWRLVLLASTIWLGVYGWIGATWPADRITDLVSETPHDDIQLGVTLFTAVEMGYYLFVSWSFRRWRDWGFVIWLLALGGVLGGLKYPL